jgi:hypothetical protein
MLLQYYFVVVVVCFKFVLKQFAPRIAPPHIQRETSPVSWSSSNFAGFAILISITSGHIARLKVHKIEIFLASILNL